ncbi:uncharacterized protein TrAFT101_001504 [Trichoderma asperellum]|uniref:Uncharacterized protein n=1 Tax=Trichoderma asperellum (strain ATCC 204424 / CBS 433.97 / NBRC 101777) TaxID=1042311 RepID=A0A2T3ZDP5_TRIA4|nr:hypothetical protein M441DRAFT_25048 [Trichoderma asperellum CBS 433.97]PTB42931.1 hypothetical protein M441DRAFT_25048 [Trichoderma asperellum CBS 433.97]UKZ85653.1 hypothetical protein TrAFT101_001504 [Trichoderma asperellum]
MSICDVLKLVATRDWQPAATVLASRVFWMQMLDGDSECARQVPLRPIKAL